MHHLSRMLLVLSFLPIALLAQNPDNKGTEFWLGFANNNNSPDALELFLTSDQSTSATVAVAGISFSTTVSVEPQSVTTVTLPNSTISSVSGVVTSKGIHITSEQEVSVYAINQRGATTDAYLGLPVDILGTEYLVLAHDSPHGGSFIQLVGTQDSTTVTVTPAASTRDGKTIDTPFNVSLDEGETVVYYSNSFADLSGSIISSDQPIAVFSGNECGEVPSGTDACDHMVEQIPPSDTWGNRFVTMPLDTRTRSIFYRFLASEDATTVTIELDTSQLELDTSQLTSTETITLDRGEFAVRDFLEPAVVNSDKPILMMQYSPGTNWDSITSDPFMVVVPPFEQFGGSTTIINVPTNVINIHRINVVAPTSAVGSVFLDGSAISPGEFQPIGESGFSGAMLAVVGGVHTVAANVAIGVTAYGFGNADSYGYPGGMLLGEVANVASMEIISLDDSTPIFSEFCAIAKVTDANNQPLQGIRVDFTVSGANPTSGFGTTDADGEALLCYSGDNIGQDTLTAFAQLGGLQDTTTIDWFGLEYELWPRWNLIFLGVDLEPDTYSTSEQGYGNTPATFFGEGFVVYRLDKEVDEVTGRPTYTYVLLDPDEELAGGHAYWVYNPGTETVIREVFNGQLIEARELSLTTAWNMTGTTLGITGLPASSPVISVLAWDGRSQRYVRAPRIGGQYFWDFVTGVFIYVTQDATYSIDREIDE